MKVKFIDGQFNAKDAIGIFTQMVHVKIKYYENKIHKDSSEEDVKFLESKIKQLQKELFEIRNCIDSKDRKITVETSFEIQK